MSAAELSAYNTAGWLEMALTPALVNIAWVAGYYLVSRSRRLKALQPRAVVLLLACCARTARMLEVGCSVRSCRFPPLLFPLVPDRQIIFVALNKRIQQNGYQVGPLRGAPPL